MGLSHLPLRTCLNELASCTCLTSFLDSLSFCCLACWGGDLARIVSGES